MGSGSFGLWFINGKLLGAVFSRWIGSIWVGNALLMRMATPGGALPDCGASCSVLAMQSGQTIAAPDCKGGGSARMKDRKSCGQIG